MSKKKKIIISITVVVLILATALTCVFTVICRQNDIKRAQEEYEQAQSTGNHGELTEPAENETSDTDIPPVMIPDSVGEKPPKDDIILDVSDRDRDPNPGVVDATVDYDTKEGADDAE